jgi:hypothetical protein
VSTRSGIRVARAIWSRLIPACSRPATRYRPNSPIDECPCSIGGSVATPPLPVNDLRYLDGCIDERPPAEAILHSADQEQVDLIVMSTHGRSGLSRLMLGSIAESVLRHTHSTILFVKPERPAATRTKEEHRDTAVP